MITSTSHYPKIFVFLVLMLSALLILSACSPAKAQGERTPASGNPQAPTTETPGLKPTIPVPPADDLGGLNPDSILLELAYEPTFFRIEASYTYGRPPVFDLLADGRVIYTQEGATYADEQIMLAQLSQEEVQALLQKVRDMGFDRLESYTDFCKTDASGQQQCIADAAYTILRMRSASGELKEVKIYADFASDKTAFTSIRDYLSGFSRPDAQPYIPSKAALFLSVDMGDNQAVAKEWPLEPALLQFPANDRNLWAIVLDGQSLAKYLEKVDRNVGDTFFVANGSIYRAYLVPWLPGVDYVTELHADFPTK